MSPDWADKPEAVPYSDLSNPQSLNSYGYVKNNPLSQADPDGHCCEAVKDFLNGWGGALGSDITAGISPRGTPNSTAGRLGAVVGDIHAAVQGALETLHGTISGIGGGVEAAATSETVVLAIPGVAAAAAGALEATHGVATAGTAIVAMGNGSYTNTHESGTVYNGKGDRARSQVTAKETEKATGDKHVATEHTSATNARESFKDESRRIDTSGGVGSNKNYNKIESPGKNYRKQDGSN